MRRTLVVVATLDTVRVLDQNLVIATHRRSWDRRRQIEDPAHIQALADYKRQAREHRGVDRLYHAVPHSRTLFTAIAHRGGNLGATTSGLLRLLDRHGARDLDQAIAIALDQGVPHLGAVRQILDLRRQAAGQPPPISPQLPDDPRVRDLVIRPHALSSYDFTQEEESNEHGPGS